MIFFFYRWKSIGRRYENEEKGDLAFTRKGSFPVNILSRQLPGKA
jgi:hypothetical protein